MKLFGRSQVRLPPVRRFSPGKVGFAVGDVHGRADLLSMMLEKIEQDVAAARRQAAVVIFLGDYVDRGSGSRAVIDLLTSGRPWGCEKVFLRGNHEEAMLGFIDDPASGRAWFRHGGLDTLVSYGIAPPSLSAGDQDLEAARDALLDALPEGHLAFLRNLDLAHVEGDYFFVHAGVDPRRPVDAQNEHDLLWIRQPFLDDDRALSHCIVHGHTPERDVHIDPRRVGLDTGAYATGRLSGARFEDEAVQPMSVGTGVTGR